MPLDQQQIYLDYQATTPVDPRVVDKMLPFFTSHFGNPSSDVHGFGKDARAALDDARVSVGNIINADGADIYFTSGATEAINLALLGTAANDPRKHIVTCATEHKAVLDPCLHLSSRGYRVTVLPVESSGIVSSALFERALCDDTLLVSIMLANNEIGTVQPIAELAAIAHDRGAFFHCDAAQGLGRVPLDIRTTPVDFVSMSAHKIYGPKGAGALYVRRQRRRATAPILFGGGQERGLRPGTPNVPALVGFGAAADILHACAADESARLRSMSARMLATLRSSVADIELNGPCTDARLPGNLNLSIAGVDSDALMIAVRELAFSKGSACTSASIQPSHVLRAIGVRDDLLFSTIRIGVGRFTTDAEVEFASNRLLQAIQQLRAIAGPAHPDNRPQTSPENVI